MTEREEHIEEMKERLRGCRDWLGDDFKVSAIADNQFFITLPVKTVFRETIMLYASVNTRGTVAFSDCNIVHDDFRFNGWGLSYARNVILGVVKHMGIGYYDRENKREITAYAKKECFSEKLRDLVTAIAALDSLMLFKLRSHKSPGTLQKDE